jgi:hypothetical protein
MLLIEGNVEASLGMALRSVMVSVQHLVVPIRVHLNLIMILKQTLDVGVEVGTRLNRAATKTEIEEALSYLLCLNVERIEGEM